MLGTWINTGTVIAGSLAGMASGNRLPERVRQIVFTSLALLTLGIGVSMVIRGTRPLIILPSIVLGAVVGELINIEKQLERFATWLQTRVRVAGGQFVRGFVTASLLFCVGPMTVVGSIQDGVSGDYSLLLTKSIMDAVSSLTLAATMGAGVLFAAATVLLVQGGLTLLGGSLAVLTDPDALNQLSGVGGLLIMALAMRMLEIKDIRVGNLLPALLIVAILVVMF